MAEELTTFKQLMQGFGVVTVMDIDIYTLAEGKSYTSVDPMIPSSWTKSNLSIETLKIANLTQEGPTKTVTGGKYANTLIKYGKTMTCEMQDAVGRGEVLEKFFGCIYDKTNDRVSITDKFPGAFAIEGRTFFIDQKTGDKVDVYIFIPQFTPDAILSLTQDAEGDATVFDLNGSLGVTKIADSDTGTPRDVFYEISDTSFFAVKS